MRVVLTGKTSAGKSAILLASKIKNIAFADNFVKDVLYEKGHPIFDFLVNLHGEEIVKDNKINTHILGKILWENPKELELVSHQVAPYVKEWILSFKKDIIIEMAAYINYEEEYKGLFDHVIEIKRDEINLNDKFIYLDKKKQPIINKELTNSLIIHNNSSIEVAIDELINILKKIKFDIEY